MNQGLNLVGFMQEPAMFIHSVVSLSTHSGADVYDRVSTFLETLYRDMEKGGCGQNAVIVSHGLFCRLFLTRYYHWSVSE